MDGLKMLIPIEFAFIVLGIWKFLELIFEMLKGFAII